MPDEVTPATKPSSGINTGLGRTLTAVYALFALAATGRSAVQLFGNAEKAPLAYSLSALAALIYIVATIASPSATAPAASPSSPAASSWPAS